MAKAKRGVKLLLSRRGRDSNRQIPAKEKWGHDKLRIRGKEARLLKCDSTGEKVQPPIPKKKKVRGFILGIGKGFISSTHLLRKKKRGGKLYDSVFSVNSEIGGNHSRACIGGGEKGQSHFAGFGTYLEGERNSILS